MVKILRDYNELSQRGRVTVCIISTIIGVGIILAVEQSQGIPLEVTIKSIVFTLSIAVIAGLTFVFVYKLVQKRQGKKEIGL